MRTTWMAVAALVVLSFAWNSSGLAVPLGTGFSYQGRLDEGGVPADGDFDFIFRLFDADMAGSQVGADLIIEDWPVIQGQFTAPLDFGAGPFAGEARWLEVAVRPGDSTDPHTVLSPRQALTAAPYALFALNGAGSMWESNGADIHNLNAGHVGVGDTTPLAALHVQDADLSLAASALLNDVAVVEDSDAVLGLYSSGGGGFGSAVALGEISDGALTNKWAMYRHTSGGGNNLGFSFGADSNYSVNPTYLTIDPDVSFVGVNRSTRLSSSEYFGIQALADEDDEYGGMYIRTDGATSWPFYGYHTGTQSAWHYLDGETDDWHLYNDGVRLTVEDDGDVGIGTLNPQVPLHVQTSNVAQFELLRLESTGEVQLTLEADTDNSGEAQNPSIFFMQDGGQVTGRVGYRIGENNFQVMQEYAGSLVLGTGNVVHMTIDADGDVGIGDTTPNARLDVEDSGACILATSSAGTAINGSGNVGVSGSGDDAGVYGSGYYGVEGVGGTVGVYGHSNANYTYGVYGECDWPDGYGVYSEGHCTVGGNFYASGSKSFKIDHPLDPANRYLCHYSLESPEVLNVYRGRIVLDARGEAWADLPRYFGSINCNFEYQLTAIGAAMPTLHVAEEIANNHFKIAGGQPGKQVSWQVTARRDDPWVRTHGAPVEQDKADRERGKYLCPELYGQPKDLRVHRPPVDRVNRDHGQPVEQ